MIFGIIGFNKKFNALSIIGLILSLLGVVISIVVGGVVFTLIILSGGGAGL